MKKIFSIIVFLLLSIAILNAQHLKKDGTPDKRYKENKTYTHKNSYTNPDSTNKTYRVGINPSVKRDKNGKIKRSASVKRDFMKQTGYPNGRKGYVVDHIIPLYKGGCDCPSNMQWQTIEDAKAKDKWE